MKLPKLPKIRRCDHCGTINPKRLYGEDRLCGECAIPNGGFYRKKGWELGTNGKVGFYSLRFPLRINWVGWWTL